MANQRNEASPLIWHKKRMLKKSAKHFQTRVMMTTTFLSILLIVGCLLTLVLMIHLSDFNSKYSYYENVSRP